MSLMRCREQRQRQRVGSEDLLVVADSDEDARESEATKLVGDSRERDEIFLSVFRRIWFPGTDLSALMDRESFIVSKCRGLNGRRVLEQRKATA
ncbi:unnamed protein product [Linum trigynum]|uniref:Uncharacterized protein n=1 Tax=Linum trigynum TaxID=586398 RepID=A0AAV2FFZ3_9ROSI